MTENIKPAIIVREQHKQLLKLIAKSFYNEMLKYGVKEAEVLSIAGHLLDNVVKSNQQTKMESDCYNQIFTVKDIQDQWSTAQCLTMQDISISPLDFSLIPQITKWLQLPAMQDNFYPHFPKSKENLHGYFKSSGRDYFSIFYQQEFVGIIGAECVDKDSVKLEMRKMVGDAKKYGKGIGKRATFLFLYYVFMIRKFDKVYLHSMDTNIRNINLNRKFGFELEGVFFEDVIIQNKKRDVVRMALTSSIWKELFT